jgi:hypothetical protein
MNNVEKKYALYPKEIRLKILDLRELILSIATNDTEIDFIGEELKWGEPSFLTKTSGSTLRIDWKEKNQDKLSLYVNCRTRLISIFKELFPEEFVYIGNREVQMPLNGRYSKKKLAKCIELVLKYNLIKNQF